MNDKEYLNFTEQCFKTKLKYFLYMEFTGNIPPHWGYKYEYRIRNRGDYLKEKDLSCWTSRMAGRREREREGGGGGGGVMRPYVEKTEFQDTDDLPSNFNEKNGSRKNLFANLN